MPKYNRRRCYQDQQSPLNSIPNLFRIVSFLELWFCSQSIVRTHHQCWIFLTDYFPNIPSMCDFSSFQRISTLGLAALLKLCKLICRKCQKRHDDEHDARLMQPTSRMTWVFLLTIWSINSKVFGQEGSPRFEHANRWFVRSTGTFHWYREHDVFASSIVSSV